MTRNCSPPIHWNYYIKLHWVGHSISTHCYTTIVNMCAHVYVCIYCNSMQLLSVQIDQLDAYLMMSMRVHVRACAVHVWVHVCARVCALHAYAYIAAVDCTNWPIRCIPDDVVTVTKEKSLFPLSNVVHHRHSSNKVHYFSTSCVVQVTATLVPSVPIYPLQAKLAVRSRFVGHS